MIAMTTFTAYALATGEIVVNITCPTVDVEANTPPGCGRVEGFFNGLIYWIDNGEPALRSAMSPIVSGLTISNLPIPCVATIEGQRYQIDDGVLELNPSLPGPYSVLLEAVPFLPCTVEVA